MNVVQFKLSNNDELLCEVVEEPDEDDINMVVRNALQIIIHDNPHEGMRMYSFRPWMMYQDQESFLQLLNVNHIIGEAKPSEMLLVQYRRALQNEQEHSKAKQEEVYERLQSIRDLIIKTANTIIDDSDTTSNVISFDSRKLH